MSKLALFLLFFVLVSNAAFLRPWENATWIASNPNIMYVGTELWWNLPDLHKTVDSINLPASSHDKVILEELEKAHTAKNSAEKNYVECMRLPELVKLWASPAHASLSVFQSFGAAASCIQYAGNWKQTVDHSLNIIELSEAHATHSISQSRISFERLERLGICNISFSARPDALCNSGQVAFLAHDFDLGEGNYGGFSIYKNHSQELSDQLRNPAPDLSSFAPAFDLLWGANGTIWLYEDIDNKSQSAEETAKLQYDVLRSTAQKRKTAAASKLSELEKQKLHLISRAPSSDQFDFAGTVADSLISLQSRKNAADLSKQEAELMRNELFSEGYLARAISTMNATAANYSNILSDAHLLSDSARLVVRQQMEDAAIELKKSSDEKKLTPDSLELLRKANASFMSAQKSTVLGVQYEKYFESAQYARMARSQRSPESQILIQSSISRLKQLITNAKVDDVDVTTEEQTLALLSGLDGREIDPYIQSAISNIISKSKLKYLDELTQTRKELINKIRLGGSLTQDLHQELLDFEDGVVVDGQLQFPDSIGRLKKLKSNYDYINEELQIHISSILGNSMSASASPVFSQVYLDLPTEILLDIAIVNPLNLEAPNVQVPITMPFPVPFLFSDIETGKDSLSALYTNENQLLVTFSNVSSHETKRLVLSRSMILAHTTSKSTHAVAIGNGVARVNEVLEFELDSPIPHLELLQGHQNASIDGADANRPLDKGKHTLETETYLSDAYAETTSNIKTYSIGPKSQVEYTITITPAIDLDKVPVLTEPINSSGISSLSIYAITGEKTTKPKKLSAQAYSAEVFDLATNIPTKIHVGYLVDDSKSYSASLLQQYGDTELASASKLLFGQAQEQFDGGNYSQAIGLLKQLQETHKTEQAQIAKIKKKSEELAMKLNSEISDLGASLPPDTGSPFLSKLEARRIELEKIRAGLSLLNLSAQVAALEAVDFRWIGKEFNSYAKSAYKEYNDLRERFYLAGNSSTPAEFSQFESSLNRFQASPQVEYAVDLDSALTNVRALVEAQEVLRSNEISERGHMVAELKKRTNSIISSYEKQYSSAKGTDYSGRFIVGVSTVEKQLKSIESSMDDDYQIFQEDVAALNTSLSKMDDVLSSLKNESLSSLSLLEHLVLNLPDSDSKTDLRKKLVIMRGLHDSGEYVNSLRAGAAVSEALDQSHSGGDDGLLILGLSAIAILAALAFYMLKPKKKPALKKVPKMGDF